MDYPIEVTLDTCSPNTSLPGPNPYTDRYNHCIIGVGEQLEGQIVMRSRKNVSLPAEPLCSIAVPSDSVCNGGSGSLASSGQSHCLGGPQPLIDWHDLFPTEEGQTIVLNFTVAGEQRFVDFMRNNPRGYHVSNPFYMHSKHEH